MYQLGKRIRRTEQKPDRLTARMTKQLGAAAVLLGLWMLFRLIMPQGTAQWGEQVNGLLTASCDLWSACSQLGEDLNQGEDLAVSVGSWCQAIFLPEQEEEDHIA